MVEHAVGRVARRTFAATVLVQCGIVVTGGLVRLTGSGLGCPTWPQCAPGSVVPVAGQSEGFHKFIEFGNRLLTFVVILVVILSILAAWRQLPRRRPLVLLASFGLLGVVGQAILGGLTVLTGLNPALVAGHFLLSMVLIAAAVALHQRGIDAGDGPVISLVRPEVKLLTWVVVGLAGLVLALGTVVTGTGPHGGDVDTPRFGLQPTMVAQAHADAVILFIALTIALWLALRLTDGPDPARRRVLVLLLVSLAQGVIGYVQYFTGVPWVLVALHLVGACAVWVAALRLPYALRERQARPERNDTTRNGSDQNGSSGSIATARNTRVR